MRENEDHNVALCSNYELLFTLHNICFITKCTKLQNKLLWNKSTLCILIFCAIKLFTNQNDNFDFIKQQSLDCRTHFLYMYAINIVNWLLYTISATNGYPLLYSLFSLSCVYPPFTKQCNTIIQWSLQVGKKCTVKGKNQRSIRF